MVGLTLRVPTSVTVLKWVFCIATALLVSLVAFLMSLAIEGANHVRMALTNTLARGSSLGGAFLLYGSFNAASATLGSLCVLWGAARASGSGLPVRAPLSARTSVPPGMGAHSRHHCADGPGLGIPQATTTNTGASCRSS